MAGGGVPADAGGRGLTTDILETEVNDEREDGTHP
jgi:hypothetical protein